MRLFSRRQKLKEMIRVLLEPPPWMRSMPELHLSSAAPLWEGGVSMVQGASRGIGLEFARQLLEKDSKGHVVATCRNPDGAKGLLELKGKFEDRLNVLPLDVTDESTIEAVTISIKENYGSLNLLVNTSGILSIPNLLHPETTLSKLEKSSLMLTYEINAVGPVLVVKHMWPLLKAGGGSGTHREFAVVANLSARVGSIGDNGLGGWHSYRSSKTALNQLTKTISMEFTRRKDPIICILLHPGTVDTDLSKPFQKSVPPDKLFTREFSVQKLLSIIDSAKRSDNGKFYAWDGKEIPCACGNVKCELIKFKRLLRISIPSI
ncbi:(-)-isopiperitenone reductase [Apostasia shenzhenica]|uniref:(-)-isopiperitenone reductase n=1 Tax=Apostasia shenzhenica TaxID=1088818 RepID=A0A2I0B2E8_9ASPA|nr:(-)-isopiperitenone reductase [Apostasia shenzhenica]